MECKTPRRLEATFCFGLDLCSGQKLNVMSFLSNFKFLGWHETLRLDLWMANLLHATSANQDYDYQKNADSSDDNKDPDFRILFEHLNLHTSIPVVTGSSHSFSSNFI